MPAQVTDAAIVVPLAFSALAEHALYLANTEKPEIAMAHMKHAFIHPQPNELHFSNFILLKNSEGEIVASISGYEGHRVQDYGSDIDSIYAELDHECVFPRLQEDDPSDYEADPDEFYIDTIAVKEQYRGQGLVEILIEEMEKVAKDKGFHKLALVAAKHKVKLLGYYQKLGFTSTDERLLGNTLYCHFIKNI